MRKFTKVCLIIAAVLLLMGTGMITVSAAMGGSLRSFPWAYHHNEWWWNDVRTEWTDSWEEADEEWNESFKEADEEWNESLKEAGMNQEKSRAEWEEVLQENEDLKETLKQDFVLKEEQAFADVKNLEIEMSAGVIQFIISETEDQIQVRVGQGEGEYHLYMEEQNTLKIKQNWRYRAGRDAQVRQIQVIVPKSYPFNEVEIEVNAGVFMAEELFAKKLDLDLKAGMILVEGGETTSLETDCAAGALFYKGTVASRVSVDCDAGKTWLCLAAEETDYDYQVKSSAGAIRIGEMVYSGLAGREKVINNSATGKMELECSAGAIDVTFEP